ncbi:MAG: imidazole glycerol phosphate synthase subunit HisH [Rhodospirillaceae bacterium TMED8]|nr:imidazole glycerol phosphate synthase subunit HisH [Magnetovibrio sp.]OUT51345.1 MAG: imidazole glycerol phosphate synthase subunit HisH [Rhodospirillaceae bacterium TMED8]|tara:strand:- start:216 stop:842 length:627 start_codon:yes stop_codon:yes gene_type:complete
MTQRKTITVVDYGMGNLWSVISAFRFLGFSPHISSDPIEISTAENLILPGVGAFPLAMKTLRERGIDIAIKKAAENRNTRILGICLGMQLLGATSTEGGQVIGLGLIPGVVTKFNQSKNKPIKVPHVGFNLVRRPKNSRLFVNLPDMADFYFVHSYRMLAEGLDGHVATCVHGDQFAAAYENDNIFATQFHPEKSQTNGLALLQNFLR